MLMCGGSTVTSLSAFCCASSLLGTTTTVRGFSLPQASQRRSTIIAIVKLFPAPVGATMIGGSLIASWWVHQRYRASSCSCWYALSSKVVVTR
jgi:hypothetical protein